MLQHGGISTAPALCSAGTGTTGSIGGYIVAVLVAQHTLGRAAQSASKAIPDVVGTTATVTVADCAGC